MRKEAGAEAGRAHIPALPNWAAGLFPTQLSESGVYLRQLWSEQEPGLTKLVRWLAKLVRRAQMDWAGLLSSQPFESEEQIGQMWRGRTWWPG